MAGKSKFQIARSLDDKIKKIANDGLDNGLPECDIAYILGFHCGNTTNYVGLTTSYRVHNSGMPVVGVVFFKEPPSDSCLEDLLRPIIEHTNSPDGIGTFKADKNGHLFLIYTCRADETPKSVVKTVFNSSTGTYLAEQPKLSVLDDSKVYNHSAAVKINLCIKLDEEDIKKSVESCKRAFSCDSKDVEIHLDQSEFVLSSSTKGDKPTESLYDHLTPPSDIEHMGDYLPQMTKSDKLKLIEKWHNKIKAQRDSFELTVTHRELTCDDDKQEAGVYKLNLESYLHLHVNDSLGKSLKLILYSIRNRLDLTRLALDLRPDGVQLEENELQSLTFRPAYVNHFVPVVYVIPRNRSPDYASLSKLRMNLHLAHLLSLDQPTFRFSQRIVSLTLESPDQLAGYLCNVHETISDKSGIKGGLRSIIKGAYTYYHYKHHHLSDSGWGCAYRSLQTIVSWFLHQGFISTPDIEMVQPRGEDKTSELRRRLHNESRPPTHEEVQRVLVDIGDKRSDFVGSEKWIGSQEICFVLDHLYNIESKIISISSGSELCDKARELGEHFVKQSTPVMIGGGVLAHTLIGIDFNSKNGDVSYLILDPHYTGEDDLISITKKGWCGWKKGTFWDKSAFYNLCLPQRPKGF